ncbi:hypothetical protein [Sphingomonas sp. LHG3443-2]|uniref:hypothetical protein n=1 Tax=Sphingomonas sp. LHG3443-2 TaxID=2804639 RepID=UPI003CFACA25
MSDGEWSLHLMVQAQRCRGLVAQSSNRELRNRLLEMAEAYEAALAGRLARPSDLENEPLQG